MDLDVRLESVVEGVLVSAHMQAPVAAECGRCLEPVSQRAGRRRGQELFGYEPDPDDEEMPLLDGDLVDVEPVLRDAVVLALPLNPICVPDCAGLCVRCGARMADVGPDHAHDDLDQRWAVLAPLQNALGSEPASEAASMTTETEEH